MKKLFKNIISNKIAYRGMRSMVRDFIIQHSHINKEKIRVMNFLKAQNITYFDYRRRFKNYYNFREYNTFEEAFKNA